MVTCGMTNKELLISIVHEMPDALLDQVLDFVLFLRARAKKKLVTATVTEFSLKKDWARPEEDAAWRRL